MTCASINTTNVWEEDEEGKSYWFPDTSTSALSAIAGGTQDLWGETSHLIDGYYGGLNRWQVLHISDTSFQAAKFQPKAKVLDEDDTDQTIYDYWSQMQDYRFKGGDEVTVYSMLELEDGVQTWQNLAQRTL